MLILFALDWFLILTSIKGIGFEWEAIEGRLEAKQIYKVHEKDEKLVMIAMAYVREYSWTHAIMSVDQKCQLGKFRNIKKFMRKIPKFWVVLILA